ncbi:MAG: hypothetical protein A3H98_02110 [Bacteroidetes bacterium RIFCSPLOWO2_02_FULL_36_8]|nr:MAG: hypothetical protein A3H98_02110 [Bacteroidetes bacterium RIFCSPLOWO2_02_FULL_36_8]OFY69214.1 MAG: hypothetical protein A3G23_06605 [Bacteroidetes bacterium RIFCSPLOWO2_12_FULL_37_12]
MLKKLNYTNGLLNQMKHSIILLGATGFTGKLIAEKLDKDSVTFTICGRSLEKLQYLTEKCTHNHECLVLDVMKEEKIKSVLFQYEIVINCVGPFNLWGNFIRNFCVQHGKIYIDISGEQSFIEQSFMMDKLAKEKGATIIHSVSFESCMADIIASEMLDSALKYSDISSYYFFRNSKPSPGTKLTMQLSKHFPTFFIHNGKMENASPLAFHKYISFDFLPGFTKALFMPYPEILFFNKKYKVNHSASYLMLNHSDAMFLLASRKQPIESVDKILKKHQSRKHNLNENDIAKQEFTLVVQAIAEDGIKITKYVHGRNMYGITAFLVSYLVKQINSGLLLKKGIVTPSETGAWSGLWNVLIKEKLITHVQELQSDEK